MFLFRLDFYFQSFYFFQVFRIRAFYLNVPIFRLNFNFFLILKIAENAFQMHFKFVNSLNS
jgi:hypothetical protein